MKRLVQLLQFNQCRPLLVMNHVFEELVEAFTDYGCKITIVREPSEMKDGGIAFVDNSTYVENAALYQKVALTCPNTVFITWYWRYQLQNVFQKQIYTGEFWLRVPIQNEYLNTYQTYMRHENFAPLLLRANEDPANIGTLQRNPIRDYCYMGTPYRQDWVPAQFNGIYHAGGWEVFLNYSQRREIYLSSTFAFGFQSDDNIENGHLSQRIFEGLAYGCIVLCENKLASIYTDGAVVYVKDKEDLIEKMLHYKANPNLLLEKQKAGYEWSKNFGTNRVAAALFMKKIKEQYNLEFTE